MFVKTDSASKRVMAAAGIIYKDWRQRMDCAYLMLLKIPRQLGCCMYEKMQVPQRYML